MSAPSRILIVEDEQRLAGVLADYLAAAGYSADIRVEGNGVVDEIRANPPDLVILDIMLPGVDGITLCREVRAFSAVPIILATARVEEIDRLLGLELGADDYICKPYSPREVVARVKAVLRRTRPVQTGSGAASTEAGPTRITLDADRLSVTAGDASAALTTVEFALLEALTGQPGRIFSRDVLMDRIYDDHRVVSDRTIDSHVKKLRRKLEDLLPDASLIHSVYGAGYRYEEPDDAP